MSKECPVCHSPLKETPKYGVLIDACLNCKGVWLDRGELEKVVSLAREFGGANEVSNGHEYYEPNKHYHDESHYGRHRKKKKHGFLDLFEDLFD